MTRSPFCAPVTCLPSWIHITGFILGTWTLKPRHKCLKGAQKPQFEKISLMRAGEGKVIQGGGDVDLGLNRIFGEMHLIVLEI